MAAYHPLNIFAESDWFKRVTWLNMPSRDVPQFSCGGKYLKDKSDSNIVLTLKILSGFFHWILSVPRSSHRLFLELYSRKTGRFLVRKDVRRLTSEHIFALTGNSSLSYRSILKVRLELTVRFRTTTRNVRENPRILTKELFMASVG